MTDKELGEIYTHLLEAKEVLNRGTLNRYSDIKRYVQDIELLLQERTKLYLDLLCAHNKENKEYPGPEAA